MALTCDHFCRLLADSRLLPPAEVASIRDQAGIGKLPNEPKALAEALVQKGQLTKFQAATLLQGKAKGLVINEYVILDKLGQGGMGVVYKALHRRMKRQVALKMLPPTDMNAPEAVQRFHREVEAAAKLSHPNVVAAYDAGEYEGRHYLVMEYVAGIDLAALLSQRGLLPLHSAIRFILQAAQGLEYAHRRGIIHRDVKPSNLLITPDGQVKVLDLGLARLVEVAKTGPTSDGLTETGQIMGTIDYMSPEQALDTRHADCRSDIYSLGCTLYRSLANRPVYNGGTVMEKLLAHREHPVPRLRDVRSDVPEKLDRVFAKMVAKEVCDRYASMGEVVTDLEACLVVRQPSVASVGVGSSDASESTDERIKSFLAGLAKQTGGPSQLPGRTEATHARQAEQETRIGAAKPTTAHRPTLGKSVRRRQPLMVAALGGMGVLLAAAVAITLLGGRGASSRQVAQTKSSDDASRQTTAGANLPASTSDKKSNDASGDARNASATSTTTHGGPANSKDWNVEWRDVDMVGRALITEKRFAAAILHYQTFGQKYQSTELAEKIRGIVFLVDGLANTAYQEVEQRARQLIADGKWAEARTALQPAIEQYGIAKFADDARVLLGEIDAKDKPTKPSPSPPAESQPTRVATEKKADPDQVSPEDQQRRDAEKRHAAAMQPIEKLAAGWDFAGALAELQKVQPAETDFPQRLTQRRDELQRMSEFKSRLIEKVNGNNEGLKKSTLSLRGTNGDIIKADEDGISAAATTGKTELHRWSELGESPRRKILQWGADLKSGDDAVTAGLLALIAKDTVYAEQQFDRARTLGTDVSPFLAPLATAAFERALEMLRQKEYGEADKVLALVEQKYGGTPWFTAESRNLAETRRRAQAEIFEGEAEKLYSEAVDYWKSNALFDVRPLVERLRREFPASLAVNDTGRKPSFEELERSVGRLGKRFSVRLDGKGDYTSIQQALDAAPERSLIEIEDSGPYREKLVVAKDGITLRGARNKWPLVTSAGTPTPFAVLLTVSVPNVTVEKLLLVHNNVLGAGPSIAYANDSTTLRSVVVWGTKCFCNNMGRIESSVVVGIELHADISMRDSLCVQGLRTDSRKCDLDNCIIVGGLTYDGISDSGVRQCTVYGPVVYGGEGKQRIVDTLFDSIEVRRPGVEIASCVAWGKVPFIDQARPGKGCFVAAPMFVNPKLFDFRLMPNSPCRGRASDGGDIGCRLTPAMIEIMAVTAELKRRGVIDF